MASENLANTNSNPRRIFLGNAHFSVLARVAMQLGRESISNSIIAISELVKNAYDADAENVNIRFFGLDVADNKRPLSIAHSYRANSSRLNASKYHSKRRKFYRFRRAMLIIEDDGNGMTEEQLRNQWMVIGTPNKAEAIQSSKKKRMLTGEKGLGRLGLDRLCEYAVLRTFARDEAEGLELLIDWRKYENTSDRLEDIEHALYKIPRTTVDPINRKPVNVPHGTQITLYNLKDIWTEEFLLRLRKELTLLVSPFAGESDFGINLESGLKLKPLDGKIGSSFMLDAAEWHIQAIITEKGQVSYTMRSSEHPEVFELPLVEWQDRFPGKPSPRCGPLSFNMYFYPRKAVELDDMKFSKSQI